MTGWEQDDGMVCAPRSNQNPDDCADHDHEPVVGREASDARWLAALSPESPVVKEPWPASTDGVGRVATAAEQVAAVERILRTCPIRSGYVIDPLAYSVREVAEKIVAALTPPAREATTEASP